MRKPEGSSGPITGLTAAPLQASWENEGGAICPGPNAPLALQTAVEPRLYSDLLAEADRRRTTDGVIVRAMIAARGH